MQREGVRVVDTPVGDRYVLEALEARGLSLGGEQSGHVIFRDFATTGDGLLTAVQVLDLMARTGRFLSDLAASAMDRFPQVQKNVRVARRDPEIAQAVARDIELAEAELGDHGRVLIRPSGTESLVRVMVEAPEDAIAHAIADRLVAAVPTAAAADPAS